MKPHSSTHEFEHRPGQIGKTLKTQVGFPVDASVATALVQKRDHQDLADVGRMEMGKLQAHTQSHGNELIGLRYNN